ncbi:MAG: DUF2167 domain-containing protein [Pseudomonadota bacterium]
MSDHPSAAFRKLPKEFLILTLMSFVPFAGVPAITHAQEAASGPFTTAAPVNVSRGQIVPSDPETFSVPKTDYCPVVSQDWGWGHCEGIDAFLVASTPKTDSMIVNTPVSDGYVTFDDWTEESAAALIVEIEASLRASASEQQRIAGYPIEFAGWRVSPTLDRDRSIMYYATDWIFDGEPTINIFATQFDRYGYVDFSVIPVATDIGAAEVKSLIVDNLALYQPAPQQDYASFQSGDKVAAVGALGLLGSFFGVKYGKAAAGGIAAALVFLKKFGIVIVLAALGLGAKLFGGLRRMLGGGRSDA